MLFGKLTHLTPVIFTEYTQMLKTSILQHNAFFAACPGYSQVLWVSGLS